MTQKKVIFVVGSTASGKSDWALELAQKFSGVIVNCDSVQAYTEVDIGSAKPSMEERQLVPHFLYDYVQPPQELTAGNYSRDFFATLNQLPEAMPVFVVGGTGFYFQAIEKGMYPVIEIDPAIKSQVLSDLDQEGGSLKLYTELQAVDPEYAAKIHVADSYRLARAVELIRSQGKSVTLIQQDFEKMKEPFPYPLLKIGPRWDMDVLRQRIQLRTERMEQAGLENEVRQLLDKGLRDWAPLKSVGYKETIEMIDGVLDRGQWHERMVINTYQLAKRQRTWFQRDKDIRWFEGNGGLESVRAQVEEFLIT